MYAERVQTLMKAYKHTAESNKMYLEASKALSKYKAEKQYMLGLSSGIQVFERIIIEQEKAWQDSVLKLLEAEIMEALSIIYPNDGYSVKLSARVLRGKVHIDGSVKSYFSQEMPWDLSDTQGRLFQQVVSFSALICIMKIMGAKTVYIDEAFSGASKQKVTLVNKLLSHVAERGCDIVLIAQDVSMASNIDANVLVLERSLDNKTTVTMGGIVGNECD